MNLIEKNEDAKLKSVGTLKDLHKPTPFSKYLAIVLFILLPFIGGWVGYTIAPEKVLEVERYISAPETEKVEDDSLQQEEVIISDEPGLQSSDGFSESIVNFDDKKVREQFGSMYVFSKDPYYYEFMSAYPLVCLPDRNNTAVTVTQIFSEKCGLYQYNTDTEKYDIVLTTDFNSVSQIYMPENEVGDGGLKILPSFSTDQRIYFSSVLWEGGGMLPLFYLDVENADGGLRATEYLIDPRVSLSPNESRFFALDTQGMPVVVDVDTLEAETITSLPDRCLVWGSVHAGGKDGFEVSWIDTDNLEIAHYKKDDCAVERPYYNGVDDGRGIENNWDVKVTKFNL